MGRHFGALLFLLLISFSVAYSDLENAKAYIVTVQNDMKPSAFSDVEQWYKATLDSVHSLTSENTKTTQNPKQDFIHVYKTVFHGFSAKLTPQQAQHLSKQHGVVAVLRDRLYQLHTTRTPYFLGLSTAKPADLVAVSDSGSNVIIGVLDTGIWPERRSFHDEGLGPIPSRWKGECVEGQNFTKSNCNKKIIGARYFFAGVEAEFGPINSSVEFKSARDDQGHGTHTASTAAGRSVGNASLFGLAAGEAVGIAPKARIAVYKVCWKIGCSTSDILAAIDKAVEDGVDVISMSIGAGPIEYHFDPIAIGAFGAMEKGVLVSASAGNSGPDNRTVTNISPWMTTVGASTIDRRFPADLVLEDGRVINGSSLYSGPPPSEKTYLPLITGTDAAAEKPGGFPAETCSGGALSKDLVRGKIVICLRGSNARVAKGVVVKDLGGVGVVVANSFPQGEGLLADAHLIPGLAITESGLSTLIDYVKSSPNPRARMVFHGTEVGIRPAPVVASFSSRGPNVQSDYVLKPDLIAPGVNILAAWPDGVGPTGLDSDTRRIEFNVISGTSMSCPHISGVAALLKGAHPDWSPAMIRSAMMTTAYTQDSQGKPILDEKAYNESKAFDMGAGHVDPEKAVDPGLAYELSTDDYLNFLCASGLTSDVVKLIARRPYDCSKNKTNPWDFNYPAIIVFLESNETVVVNRTVTHVSEGAGNYNVTVTSSKGVNVTVNPVRMEFKSKGEKKSYSVTIKVAKRTEPEEGRITWSDGRRQVGSPVVLPW